jgi:hypothetical protein
MDCILRFLHPQPPPESRWKFSLQDSSGSLLFSAQRTDASGGWPIGFRLQMLTSSNEIQMIQLKMCKLHLFHIYIEDVCKYDPNMNSYPLLVWLYENNHRILDHNQDYNEWQIHDHLDQF